MLSAFVLLEPETDSILEKGKIPNTELRSKLIAMSKDLRYSILAIEGMQSFGANIGRTVLDTCTWIGRFSEVSKAPTIWPVFRPQVLIHHTGKMKGGDSAIRGAMIQRFGCESSKALAEGKSIRDKACPLFGVVADMWSALAIASCVSDKVRAGDTCPTDPQCMVHGFSAN